MTEEHVLRFEPSAYIQHLLGKELISNQWIAVAELVKNAYDAGARLVTITLHRGHPQRLHIKDDGQGMSLSEFKRIWMTPGYSEKPSARSADRPLLGEKGIGRFASDKLAADLTVITKQSRERAALQVIFHWGYFDDRSKSLSEIEIPYAHVNSDEFGQYESGTLLELTNLRTQWDLPAWKRLKRELQSLVSPFRTVRGFKIVAVADGWPSGEVVSLFQAYPGYKYAFSVTRGGRIARTLSRPPATAAVLHRQVEEKERSYYGTPPFGPISGSFYYLDKPTAAKKAGFEPGVAIYRDGFRVEPYGRESDDWLSVRSWKASRHGHAPISPPRLFGFIDISRNNNPDLRDLTNREGLIDNPSFQAFQQFVKEEFQRFAAIVEDEKARDETESPAYTAQRATEARTVKHATFSEIASQLAHQLRQPLQVIRSDADSIEALVANPVTIRDPRLADSIRSIKAAVRDINDHITLMQRMSASVAGQIITFDLATWLSERAEAARLQDPTHQISIRTEGCAEERNVVFSREVLAFVIDNFIGNALAACNASSDPPREIVIALSDGTEMDHLILVNDNGPGVPDNIRPRLFSHSVPSSTGGTGFGLKYSYDLISENGGAIGFHPRSPMGATFFVQFNDQEA